MNGFRFKRRAGQLAWLAACTCPAIATAGEGLYLGLEGGVNYVERQTFKIYGDGGLVQMDDGTTFARNRFKDGYVGGLVMGFSGSGGLRPEIELNYRENDLKNGKLGDSGILGDAANTGFFVGGKEQASTAMANVWLDFFKSSRVHPYIGGGIGAARLDVRNASFNGVDLRNEDDTVFAYQGGAGLAFDLGDRVTISADYRYLRSNRGSFNFLEDQPTTRLKARYESQAAMLGLRYYFDGPVAPPPPEPAPAPEPTPPVVEVVPPPPPPPPACEFPAQPGTPMTMEGCKIGDVIVLRGVNFEFNKDGLTTNAKVLLDTVKDALQARPDIKIEVDGHTDDKGSDTYNQALSLRRAASVRRYLVSQDIEAGRLTTRGLGETTPIADNGTDEGREMNRRVELHITESSLAMPPPVEATITPAP